MTSRVLANAHQGQTQVGPSSPGPSSLGLALLPLPGAECPCVQSLQPFWRGGPEGWAACQAGSLGAEISGRTRLWASLGRVLVSHGSRDGAHALFSPGNPSLFSQLRQAGLSLACFLGSGIRCVPSCRGTKGRLLLVMPVSPPGQE